VLVKRLLTNRRALAEAAEGILDGPEQELMRRPGARRLDEEPWSMAELVLVDEAEALLNGHPRTYGHVVVDEAQDLSAMELRAVARRAPKRSMTILGDLAQATAPGAVRSWEDAVRHLGSPLTASIEELELGYRVPKPILDVANRLLPGAAPGGRPARAVRLEGAAPTFVAATDAADLAAEVVRVVQEQAATWGSVGVVVPEAMADRIGAALAVAGVTFGDGRRGGLTDVVTLLLPPEAKGLEFDAVVVVEPAGFLAGGDVESELGRQLGGRLLYIALTRAVQELTIVHAAPLPAALVS
jgi:DNA helicase IV